MPSSRATASAGAAALSWSMVSGMSGSSGRERMHRLPVPGDVDAAADPDPLVALHVVEEALERADAARLAEQAAVHADAHHLRRGLAFGVEGVEAVLQVVEEVVAG